MRLEISDMAAVRRRRRPLRVTMHGDLDDLADAILTVRALQAFDCEARLSDPSPGALCRAPITRGTLR